MICWLQIEVEFICMCCIIDNGCFLFYDVQMYFIFFEYFMQIEIGKVLMEEVVDVLVGVGVFCDDGMVVLEK